MRTRWDVLWTLCGVLAACDAFDPPPEDGQFSACCGGTGSCIPGALVPAQLSARLSQDSCDVAQLCAPDRWLDDPQANAASCETAGREGRCLPSCLPEVSARAADLQREQCAAQELCVPCYDPLSGQDTQACRINTDLPQRAPEPFGTCCGDLGRCIPAPTLAQTVAPENVKRLGQLECSQAELCVPSDWLGDAPPTACRTLGDREGRCLAACLPELAEQRDGLERATCDAGELCAPCFDPLSGEDTQACRIGSDQPRDPARSFPLCCEDKGRCLPASVLATSVSADDARRLGVDSCEAGSSCVPAAWLEGEPALASCRTAGDREGRCMPACLPEVAAQADRLAQESCAGGERCVPCFDPLSGEETRACRLSVDQPRDPPGTFERCCGDQGRCLPASVLAMSVSPEDAERLGMDRCAQGNACVPEAWLQEELPVPSSCRTAGDREGRCLLACLPDVAAQIDRLARETCDDDERCVPCFDPLSGQDTKACGLGTDQPREPARSFPRCCQDKGHCLPASVLAMSVSADDARRLGVDSCDTGSSCVPEAWLTRGEPTLASCRTAGEREGRCMLSCLPDVASQGDRLAQETCSEDERCVPCFDPLQGTSTGVCELGDDSAHEPPRPFADCCGGGGRCIPPASLRSSVSSTDAAQLSADTCTEGALCVPDPWLTAEGPTARACSIPGNLEGRCLPSCLPAVAAQANQLQQASCDAQQLCVPCFDPLTGRDTGACHIGDDEPRGPARTYPSCCGTGGAEQGVCLPLELLSAEQAQSLPVDSCVGEARCVPRILATPPNKLPACTGSVIVDPSSTGVCVPTCLLSPVQSLLAPNGSCGNAQRCVNCDQLPGSAQGGCP